MRTAISLLNPDRPLVLTRVGMEGRQSETVACTREIYCAACCGLASCPLSLFQVAAKKLDRRLLDLGASPLLPRGLGDDQHPSG